MYQLDGFLDSRKEDYVCLLKKSLYGLKQSPRQWCKRFDAFMISHDYVRNQYDNCVYSTKLLDGSFIYCCYMLIATSSKVGIDNLKTLLSSEFEIKDLGAAKKIPGMEIWRNRKASLLYFS